MSDALSLGDYVLSLKPIATTGAWFVREERGMVDGIATIYTAKGSHGLEMEIHSIELVNGDRWIVAGEAFNGPKWVFGQLNGRLRISVNQRPQGFVLDLTIPRPGKRNQEIYTASRSSVADISEVEPDIFTLLHDMGAAKIGERSELIGDESTRKRFLCILMDEPDCLAPVVSYFITRTMALCLEYERLLAGGLVEDEQVSHYAEMATKPGPPKEGVLAEIIAEGETAFVEFKPAIWYNHSRAMNEPDYIPGKDNSVSDNIVRTVAGFLNAEGGKLFIGVGDDGSSYGIENDVLLTGRNDMDGLENELVRLLSASLSNEVVATKVKVSFPSYDGKTIALIEVKRADAPVFMKTNRHRNKFYVRIGNATNTMSVESAFNYISQRDWSGSE